MTRRVSVLFVLAFFVMSLGSLAFAAKAEQADRNSPSVSEPEFAPMGMTPRHDDGSRVVTSGKPGTAQPTSLGYYMVLGTVTVGSTEVDFQSYDSQQRQVAIGSDNKIHTVWTFQTGIDETAGDRTVYYNGYNAGSAPGSATGGSMSPANGGWGTIGVGPTGGLAYAAYRYGIVPPTGHGPYDPRWRMAIGKQTSEFSTVFAMSAYPTADTFMAKILNCEGIKTGMDTVEGGYTFPVIATDVNGSGKTIVHALAWENARPAIAGGLGGDTTGKHSLVYYRTDTNGVHPSTTCGTFIDSTDNGINYEILANPTNDQVAAVYTKPHRWTGYDIYSSDNDILYKVSNNLGDTWGTADTIFSLSYKDTTNANGKVYFMRALELSALYDNTGCLHVLYTIGWQSDDGYYLLYSVRLNHWSKCPTACTVTLLDNRQNRPGSWWPSGSITAAGNDLQICKPSLTQCTVASGPDAGTRLYAVYTLCPDSTGLTAPNNKHADRSGGSPAKLNADIVVQGSTDISGQLWGPPINITNTKTNGCAAGLCASEQFTNTAIYSNDSMRIQYLLDLDAGEDYAYNNNGVATTNPILIKAYQCFSIPTEAILSAKPDSILWPFHTVPGGTNSVPVMLTNTGTTNANYTRSVNYISGTNWLTFANTSTTGTVPAGCATTLAETITAHGPATEGFYQAVITWAYTGSKTYSIPVDLYNYGVANWFLEANNTIATSYVTIVTNQNSRVGNQRGGFKYVSDGGALKDTAYIYDGGLVIGTSSTTLSAGSMSDSAGAGGQGDPNIGRMFCLSNLTIDATGGATPYGYRHSSGMGCNKDSTIGFDVDFYAPKHVDSSNFIIGKFSLYAGPKNPAATINNVTVAYAADWDIPDTSSDNRGGFDSTLQMLYQRGVYDSDTTRFGAMSGWRDDGVKLSGGKILSNTHWIYRLTGFQSDTLWSLLQSTTSFGFGPGYIVTGPPLDTIADLNQLLVFSKTATIKPKASGVFTVYVIYAGQAGPKAFPDFPLHSGTYVNLKAEIAKAKAFICAEGIAPSGSIFCASCTACGNANGDAAINISDAVFLIAFIFAHGTPPADCNYAKGMGDANGDGVVNISDAVYLIAYIFAHGNPPHCQGM